MSQNFNQKIGFEFSKETQDTDRLKNELHRTTGLKPKNLAEITIRDAKLQLLKTNKFDAIDEVIGAGKEATVLKARLKDQTTNICAKIYRYYTSTNSKRVNGSKHIQWDEMAIYAATREFWNLHALYNTGIPVPKPIELIDNIVIMEYISSPFDSQAPGPLLHSLPQEMFDDPEPVLYEAIDILVRIFLEAHFTHGDYNDHNLMMTAKGLYTMDVTQSMEYNQKTYVDTPVRIRIDKAARIFRQDLDNLNQNFQQKFRLSVDTDLIYRNTIEQLPDHLQTFMQGRNEINTYKQYVPELYRLKEQTRKSGVRSRSKRRYQQKKR